MAGCVRCGRKALASFLRRFDTRGVWRAVLVVYLVALSFLSLNPWIRPVSTSAVLSPDKIDHAIAYGGLAILIYFCLSRSPSWRGRSQSATWLAALVAATFVGVLLEVCQGLLTRNRTGSVEDAVANGIGATVGFVLLRAVGWLYRRVTIQSTRRTP